MTRRTAPTLSRPFSQQATAFVLALGTTFALMGSVNQLATEPARAADGLPLTATMAATPAAAANQVVVITARRDA